MKTCSERSATGRQCGASWTCTSIICLAIIAMPIRNVPRAISSCRSGCADQWWSWTGKRRERIRPKKWLWDECSTELDKLLERALAGVERQNIPRHWGDSRALTDNHGTSWRHDDVEFRVRVAEFAWCPCWTVKIGLLAMVSSVEVGWMIRREEQWIERRLQWIKNSVMKIANTHEGHILSYIPSTHWYLMM